VRIERADTNDGITFTLIGRLEGGAARHLTRVVRGPVSDGSTVTLDLSALESCDADGLRALGTLLDRARAASGRLVLASPTEPIREILAAFELRDALHVTGDPPINVRYLFRVNCADHSHTHPDASTSISPATTACGPTSLPAGCSPRDPVPFSRTVPVPSTTTRKMASRCSRKCRLRPINRRLTLVA
jgi:anti-anti-sigma regulatory factor